MIQWLNGGRSPYQNQSAIHKSWQQIGGGAIALLLTLLGQGAIAIPTTWVTLRSQTLPAPQSYELASHYPTRPSRSRQERGEPLRRPPDAIPPNNSDACATLTAMANIAYLWDLGANQTEEVEGQQVAVCWGRDTEASVRIPRWPSGNTMRLGSRWYYPNGQSAQFSDNWNYPNGRSITFGNSWYYPDGSTARFASFWYTPDGRRVSESELLAIACAEVGSRRCANRLNEVGQDEGFWYTLTLLQLAWLGEQIEEGRINPD